MQDEVYAVFRFAIQRYFMMEGGGGVWRFNAAQDKLWNINGILSTVNRIIAKMSQNRCVSLFNPRLVGEGVGRNGSPQ